MALVPSDDGAEDEPLPELGLAFVNCSAVG